MKKVVLLLVLLMCGCATKMVLVPPTVQAQYLRRMAILPFYVGSNCDWRSGVNLADGIQTKLAANAPQLELVERQRVDDIIKEWGLVERGIVDPNTAVNIGRLAGARLIMTGQVLNLAVNRGQEMMYGSLRVTVRIIDVERGIIKWAQEVKVDLPGLFGRYSAYYKYTGRDEFVGDMIELACDKIAKNFYLHEEKM